MEEKKVDHAIHATHVQKKINWLKVGIVSGIIAVIILAIIWIPAVAKGQKISEGDTVQFEYSITLPDGTEVSNSTQLKIGEVADSFGFVTKALDDSLGNISLNKEQTITLSAADAFGEYDDSKILIENRTSIIGNRSIQEINRTFDVPSGAFNQVFGENAVLNKEYASNDAIIWDTKVVKVLNDSAILSIENKAGETLVLDQARFVEIVELTADKVKVRLNANTTTIQNDNGNYSVGVVGNDIVVTWTPIIGSEIAYGFSMVKILSYNETSIVMDSNNPYAGKEVTITLKAVKVVKKAAAVSSSSEIKTISGAPTLETFVMTHCPYGTQMEKGVIPAYKLLAGKANFKIRFVSYTMHGAKEDTETKRQICIREETNKFWEYLECFLADETSASKCIDETGIDEAKISDCMDSRAEDYWAADKALNTKYGVKGSPTNILNGQETQIYPRSPEDVKKAVCAAFASEPSECSETLDTANPSTGFGYSASSSGSAASCG